MLIEVDPENQQLGAQALAAGCSPETVAELLDAVAGYQVEDELVPGDGGGRLDTLIIQVIGEGRLVRAVERVEAELEGL